MGEIVVSHSAFLRDDSGRFISKLHAGAEAAVTQLANMIASRADSYAPERTGRLKGTIMALVNGTEGFAIAGGAAAPYAAAQEKGAVPHVITKRDPDNAAGGILVNREQGFYSNRAVNHPGNPAVRFLQRAGQEIGAISAAIVKAHMPG